MQYIRYIMLDENNRVVSTRQGSEIVVGEIQSDTGEIGQIKQEDGSFVDDIVTPAESIGSIESRLARIEDTQDLILLKLEGVI